MSVKCFAKRKITFVLNQTSRNMLSTKRFCSFCTQSMLRGLCAIHSSVNSGIIREYSSKKSKRAYQNTNKIQVKAKSDFVTYQLNTSISAHLKRQQTIWNDAEKREKQFYYQNKLKNFDCDRNRQSHKQWSNQKAANNLSGDSSDIESDDYSLEQLEMPPWEHMDLVEINKKFYRPSAITENRSIQEVNDFHTRAQIKVDSDLPKPIFRFDELNHLSPTLIETVKRRFDQCTPIQSQAIPLAVSEGNAILISPSGSGKMLAMVLSTLIHISHQIPKENGQGPVAVILALTPEIAEQILQMAYEICKGTSIRCTTLCSSSKKLKNRAKQAEVGDLLITTPFHLYDLLKSNTLTLERCSQLASYEADKMVRMGLDEEIVQIESQIRPECQRLLWCSSWTSDLLKVATNDYSRLEVGSSEINIVIAQSIQQIVKISNESKKEESLFEIIDAIVRQNAYRKTLIFTETPAKANRVANILQKKKCRVHSLHNQKSTAQQDATVSLFESEKLQFLVTTDLAVKNIQFNRITNVINFDMPDCIADYVCRVNRAGRLGNDITHAYSIVTEEDGDLADDLIMILQQSNQPVDPGLMILKAANADSDDEVSFAVPSKEGFNKYTIDNNLK